MKIFVTGATGFIGTHFVRFALSQGHRVLASRLSSSQAAAGLEAATWITRSLDEIKPADLTGCDALVHFAAAGVSPQQATRAELTRWNVAAPLVLIENARVAGVRRFVLAGSFAEYGRSADKHDPIPPDAALLPTTHYASSKAACFVCSHGMAVEAGLELCYLRVFSAYGEGQFAANFWPALKQAALAGRDFPMTAGEQVRDFIDVQAVAAQFLQAASRSDVEPGRPLVRNVGTGHPVEMKEFAKRWWKHWKATGELQIGALPYRANEVMRFVPLITD